MVFTDDQIKRYSRQMLLSGIGGAGQEKLLSSKVLVAGAGGLGSACLLYLAGAGVGTIGVVDFDTVEYSNLHRQIIYATSDLGKSKVFSVKEKINQINPDVNVIAFNEKLDKTNIQNIFNDFEIIVDGLDSFKDKFLINDYCVKFSKKLVHAGAVGFEGQLFCIVPDNSACLRCVLPEVPSDFRHSCSEVGVFPGTVGVLSVLQANEVMKLILGIGEPLVNRILKFNSLTSAFYELNLQDKIKSCSLHNPI